MAGLGIALISLHTVIEELRQGRLVALRAPGLPFVRHWFLVHPLAHQTPTPAAQAGAGANPSRARRHICLPSLISTCRVCSA